MRAPYFLTAAAVGPMIARGSGSVVNISTMAARFAVPGLSVYGATKAALDSLTRSWAAEFAGAGIRVNGVAPGPTHTANSGWSPEVAAMMDKLREDLGATTALKRAAAPAEIAEVVLFLAGDRSSYVTGVTLAADGGRVAI